MSQSPELFGDDLWKAWQPPTFADLPDIEIEGDARAWAVFSRDRRYRYLLSRLWAPDTTMMVFGMLNPSKAGAFVEDPSVRKCIGFAKKHGCGGIIVCNAGAFIATHPRDLAVARDPIGPHNERMILWACRTPLMAIGVAAWGRLPPGILSHNRRKLRDSMFAMRRSRLHWCFGKTKNGEPRHPLMLPYATPLEHLQDGRRFP